jgi:chemotaxis signal transduction protein
VSRKKQVSSLLTFRVGPFRFCVDAVEAEAIIEKPHIRSVPGTPRSIVGVFSHRGRIAVAVSLRPKLGLPDPGQDDSGQLIVTWIADEPKGFWVDEVLDLHQDPDLQWQNLPDLQKNSIVDHVTVLADIILLHTGFEKLFYAEDSGELYKILSAAAGDKGMPPGSDCDLSSELRQFSGNIRSDAMESSFEMPEENSADRAAASEGPEESESKNVVTCETGIPTPTKTVSGRTAVQGTTSVVRRMSSKGMELAKSKSNEPAIRLYSGPGHNPISNRRADINTRPYIDENQYRSYPVHSEKPSKRRTQSKILMAGFTILLILGVATTFWWPVNRNGEDNSLVGSVYAVEQKHDPLDSKTITPQPYDGGEIALPVLARSEHKPIKAVATSVSSQVDPAGKELSKEDADTVNRLIKLGDDEVVSSPSRGNSGQPHDEKPAPETASPAKELSEPDPLQREKRFDGSPSSEKPSEEILRIVTEDFTMTIKRPETPHTDQPPPETTTEIAEERFIHVVVKGDTLWDIADHYLGNPFRYPELAQLSHIKDPHWIYPGDIITIVRKKIPGKLVD